MSELQDLYDQTETNPDYDAKTSFGGILMDYGVAPAKGATRGLLEIPNIPSYIEGLARMGINAGGGLLSSSDSPLVNPDPFIPAPTFDFIQNADFLKPSNTSVNYFPDPSSVQKGFEYGSMMAIDPTKARTFTSLAGIKGNVSKQVPYMKSGTAFGTAIGTTQELSPDATIDTGIEIAGVLANMIYDFKTGRTQRFAENQMSKVFNDAEINILKTESEIKAMQKKLEQARAMGITLDATDLFTDYPNVAKLMRVLQYTDDGQQLKNMLGKGKDAINSLEELLDISIGRLDDSVGNITPSQFAKQLQDDFNQRNKDARNNFRNFTDVDGNGWIQNPVNQVYKDEVVIIASDVRRQLDAKVAKGIDDNVDRVMLEFLESFENLAKVENLGTMDKADNAIRVLIKKYDDIKNEKGAYKDFGGMPQIMDGIILRGIEEAKLKLRQSDNIYADAVEAFKKEKELYVDPVRKSEILSNMMSGNPKVVINAINEMVNNKILVGDEIEPIIESLNRIGGKNMINTVLTQYLGNVIKNTVNPKKTDLANTIAISNKLIGNEVAKERLFLLLNEIKKNSQDPTWFTSSGSKSLKQTEMEELAVGLEAWLDTTSTFKNPASESITSYSREFVDQAEQIGLMVTDITNPSMLNTKFRTAWGEYNIAQLSKALNNNPQKTYNLLMEMARESQKGSPRKVLEGLVSAIYYTTAKGVPSALPLTYENIEEGEKILNGYEPPVTNNLFDNQF